LKWVRHAVRHRGERPSPLPESARTSAARLPYLYYVAWELRAHPTDTIFNVGHLWTLIAMAVASSRSKEIDMIRYWYTTQKAVVLVAVLEQLQIIVCEV